MTSSHSSTQYDKKREETRLKISRALERLSAEAESSAADQAKCSLNVTMLAREAGVSRNAIYTSHREFVDRLAEIRKDIRIRSQRRPKTEDKVAELLETNRELNLRIRRLTTINASLHVELNEARKRI